MRPVALGGALLIGSLLWAQSAAATTITQTITFAASDFASVSGNVPAPVSPVSGSFKLTFDPALIYTNETSGILLNGIDIAVGGVPVFSYVPNFGDVVTIGMDLAGGSGVQWGTNDFFLLFSLTSNAPLSVTFGYSQVGSDNFFTTNNVALTRVTQTPIPGSVLMLLTGLGAMGGVGFFRKRNAATSAVPAAA